MPITIDADLRTLSQDEFGDIAYQTMGHAFDIHRELGRFFDEEIYQAELAHRCRKARTEVRIEVSFDGFCKLYSIDLLVDDAAVFEIKAADSLHDRHRAQLLNYLLLGELAHGKLVNFRPVAVQHEFVNTNLTRLRRTIFEVDDSRWQSLDMTDLKQRLTAMLRDVGTGLDVQLYKEALIHWLGGPVIAVNKVDVIVGGRRVGTHETVCTPDRAGIEITALKPHDLRAFEEQYQRLLNHANLVAMHWINISRPVVTFQTLLPEK